MSICKNWEPFSLSRRPRYIYLGQKNTVFPPLPLLFLWSRSWGVSTWPLVEAQPPYWLCRGDISSLTEALVQLLAESSRNMDLGEGWKTDNTSTMWHLSVHPCDQVASACLHMPQPVPKQTWSYTKAKKRDRWSTDDSGSGLAAHYSCTPVFC